MKSGLNGSFSDCVALNLCNKTTRKLLDIIKIIDTIAFSFASYSEYLI